MFENIALIKKEDHKDLKIGQIDSVDFARNSTFIPISAVEFFKACKSQPILFYKKDEQIECGILLGLKEKSNLFITSKRKWRTGEYIPSIVRQYPFIFVQTNEGASLAYDTSCKAINTKKGDSLFNKNGEISDKFNKIISGMEQFYKDLLMTKSLISKLIDLDLLMPYDLQIKISDEQYRLNGFMVIDEEKLNNLSDTDKLFIQSNGMYQLMIAHLLSLGNFEKLSAYVLERKI